jgi:hypothetical protein
VLDFLVRTHDELVARIPGKSIEVDGNYGGYAVTAVAREDAVSTARLLVSWWEGMLASDLERWPISGITLNIGGTADEPELSYAVDLGESEEAPMGLEEKRKEAQRAVAAGTGNLDNLEALTKARVRSGYAVQFGFTPINFMPQVVVEDLDSGDENRDETAEIVEAIRFHNPATKVTA